MIGAVLRWKDRTFRYNYSFFSPCCVGINCCNATLHFYRNSFQNIICNGFVPHGSAEAMQTTGGGKKALKGGVRRLRPELWQRTKCTFGKCTLVPSSDLDGPHSRVRQWGFSNGFFVVWLCGGLKGGLGEGLERGWGKGWRGVEEGSETGFGGLGLLYFKILVWNTHERSLDSLPNLAVRRSRVLRDFLPRVPAETYLAQVSVAPRVVGRNHPHVDTSLGLGIRWTHPGNPSRNNAKINRFLVYPLAENWRENMLGSTKWNWRGMPTSWGVNFGGVGPETWKTRPNNSRGKFSPSKLREKFAGNFPKIRQAKLKKSPQISAAPRARRFQFLRCKNYVAYRAIFHTPPPPTPEDTP